ncbi:MAG: sulfatase [Gemmatales bacterium]|nr:MAG: sulfatase [Gemmatales bacterium]
MMHDHIRQLVSRRTFLGQTGVGIMALSSLLARDAEAEPIQRWRGVVQPLHHPAKARRIIHLYMAGGPSHLETFDYKPKLAAMHGQPMPESLTKGQPIAQLQGRQLKCFGPQHPFRRFGKSGQEIAEIFPRIGEVADDICIVRSMRTVAINHDPAHTFMNTGTTISGRPAMGSWLLYGLGSESDNLPGFVVLTSVGRFGQAQPIATRQWQAGFLPSRFQGVEFRSKGDPVLYVRSPSGTDDDRQRDIVSAVQQLNRYHNRLVEDPEIATRIAQYEMAFRMQTSVPELMDLSREPKRILDMYGTKGADGTFAANCLLARRLAERGVRFIQLYHRAWDHHGNVKRNIAGTASEVDQPCAALIRDLKQRGMLDDTIILWGGEFGRTPMAQGNGRDHHIKGFSCWLAGGGIRGGITYGATDDLGYNAVENIVEVHDLHATLLHLLGIDHTRLTFKFQGRDFRLTDVHGNVVHDILA